MIGDACARLVWVGLGQFVFMVAGSIHAHAQTIRFEHQSPAVIDRAVVVAPGEFSAGSTKDMSRRFLREIGGGKTLARLTIATKETAIMSSRLHGSPVQNDYESTMGEIRRYRLPELPIARLLMIGNSALFSYRDARVYSEEVIAGTADPTLLREGDTHFRLLHFRLTEPGPALRASDYTLQVYLKASPTVSINACIAITKRLADLTRVSLLRVEVRPDVWFMQDLNFPAVFPFQKTIKAPTKLEFEIAPYVSCGSDVRWGIQCNGRSFRP